MKYLIDTCVITDFIKNHQGTVKRIESLKPNDLCISVITVSEIEYGIQKIKGTKQGELISKTSNLLISSIEELDVDHEIAIEAGKIRSELSKIGKPIGAYDLLIAATAKHYELVVVTSNVTEFGRVENLLIENWRT